MRIEVIPRSFPGAAELARRAVEAAIHVDLDASVGHIGLVLDAPEFEGSGFWQREEDGHGVAGPVLYGAPQDLLVPSPLGEPIRALDPSGLATLETTALDRLRVDRWLHRNFLQLDDLVRTRVRPAEITATDSEALQACWDVWTDGRLRQWQHPGLSQAERRRIFYRVFARRGVLTPRHWEIFHDLWEGRLTGQEGLQAALDGLPTP